MKKGMLFILVQKYIKTTNIVKVFRIFQVFQALAKDSENAKDESQKEFGQEIPTNKPWEKTSGPPILPPHLLQVILNKDTPLSVSRYRAKYFFRKIFSQY